MQSTMLELLKKFTIMEIEVMALQLQGYDNSTIAQAHHISVEAVEHNSNSGWGKIMGTLPATVRDFILWLKPKDSYLYLQPLSQLSSVIFSSN